MNETAETEFCVCGTPMRPCDGCGEPRCYGCIPAGDGRDCDGAIGFRPLMTVVA